MSPTVLGYRVGAERRVEGLPRGTQVLLSSGKVAVLVACSFTRALVRLDTGAEIAVAPAAKLEVLEPVSDGPRDDEPRDATPGRRAMDIVGAGEAAAGPALPVSGPITDARERAQRASNGGQENASDAAGRPRAHPPPSDASGIALEGLGRTPCPTCGARFTRQRPWQVF